VIGLGRNNHTGKTEKRGGSSKKSFTIFDKMGLKKRAITSLKEKRETIPAISSEKRGKRQGKGHLEETLSINYSQPKRPPSGGGEERTRRREELKIEMVYSALGKKDFLTLSNSTEKKLDDIRKEGGALEAQRKKKILPQKNFSYLT